MRTLVLNAGSSSAKYDVFVLPENRALLSGSIDQIGETHSAVKDHADAFTQIMAKLSDNGINQLDVIGHRVVHGGETFGEPAVIDDATVARLRSLTPLAPLHNPANLAGITAARAQYPDIPHVAVFDTAFHSTMPEQARRYAIPALIEHQHGIRRYGFHGISYAYITRTAAEWLGKSALKTNLIAMHLGNGASICAIRNGRSVDTSMGFTPLEGLVMGTRAGDIDAGAVFHLLRDNRMTPAEAEALLNRNSGLVGLCGDQDMRVITQRASVGDELAETALQLFCYRLQKHIGAYLAVLPDVDALVFTGGIGEHRAEVRERVCKALAHLGVRISSRSNQAPSGDDRYIDDATSSVRILVLKTNEALEIARQCAAALKASVPAGC